MFSLYPFVLRETLRLLHMNNKNAKADFLKNTEELYKTLINHIVPKTLLTRVNISIEEDCVDFGSFTVQSVGLSKLLEHCESCFLIAVTLGAEIDKLISRTQIEDMSDAVVLDALASSLADIICDKSEARAIESLSEKEFLTMRFSPGYGDVPLDASEGILDTLNAKKKMGVGLTKSFMLIPIKSVTAFIGISNRKEKRGISCDVCAISNQCLYRKRGDFCGIHNK